MRLRTSWLVFVFAFFVALFGCRKSGTCGRAKDASVVACVDDVAVTRKQVESYVQEPWWVPGSAVLPDARKAALARATRAILFQAEAKRRGLVPAAGAPKDAVASWVQALIADESAKRGISRDAITDAEAIKQYEENKFLYQPVEKVEAQVIVSASAEAASKLYPEASKADEAAFRALATAHSIDEKTKAKGGDRTVLAVDDEDHTLLKVVLSNPRPGLVLGPFKAGDGRWYLLRIKSVPLEHEKALDDNMKAAMKNVLVEQRRNKALDELEATLRSRAKIEVFDDALAAVTVPKFD